MYISNFAKKLKRLKLYNLQEYKDYFDYELEGDFEEFPMLIDFLKVTPSLANI